MSVEGDKMLRQRKRNNNDKTNDTKTTTSSTTAGTQKDKDQYEHAKKEERPSTLQVWILASRPHTLTASLAPVLVGQAIVQFYIHTTAPYLLDSNDSSSLTKISILFGAFACSIQLATNLHNDYADFIKGADTDERVGQARATQKGWLSPRETAMGATVCLMIAGILGYILEGMAMERSRLGKMGNGGVEGHGHDEYDRSHESGDGDAMKHELHTHSCECCWDFDVYMTFVTLTSMFNAVCYTGGPYPLGYIGLGHWSIGYSGLGDIFVFLYFGLVATITVPYIFIRRIDTGMGENDPGISMEDAFGHELFWMTLYAALPVGFMATAIIVVNNLRDRGTDVKVGKNTLAVRFGEAFARIEYMVLMIGSYLMLIPFSVMNMFTRGGSVVNLWLYLPLLSLPVAMKELKAMNFGGKDGAALNPHVGGTAKVQLLYCILFVIALKMSS